MVRKAPIVAPLSWRARFRGGEGFWAGTRACAGGRILSDLAGTDPRSRMIKSW